MKNKDIYIQDDISSCGARCIQSIVSHYDGYVPLETVLEDTNTNKSGTNALELVTALKKYGFKSYGLKTSLESIDANKLPCIAHTIKNGYEHFLVIYKIDETEVLTMDPEVGKTTYKKDDFKSIFTDEVIIALPEGEITKYKKSKSILKIFKPLLVKVSSKLIIVSILSLLLLLMTIVINYHIKILNYSDNPLIITLILLILQVFVCIFQYAKENLLLSVLKYIDENTLNTFTTHIFKLPIRYLNNKRVGEIVKKIEDMTYIKNFLLRMTIINLLDLITVITCGVVLFNISVYLTLVYACFVLIYLSITIFTSKKVYRDEKEVLRLYNQYSGTLVEYIDGIESIKNLNEEETYLKRIDDSFKNQSVASLIKNKRKAKIDALRSFTLGAGVLIANVIGFLSLSESFTLYDLIAYTSIFSLVFNSVESILETFLQFLKGKAIFRAICEFNDVSEERTSRQYKKPFKSLKIDNLTYSYDHYHYTLKNFSYTIHKGDKILIKGPSGIGKSTLVKAISGRLNAYDGKIFLNGINIEELSLKSLRSYCLYVGQEEKLFTGSIIENVVQVEPDKERFDVVSQITMMNELIAKRRDRENTSILEGASNLSGGEKARVILARALYKNPSILIIDETLSSVTEEMEDKILDNLLTMSDLTLIYITHRNKEKKFKKVINFRKDGTYEIKRNGTNRS